MPFVLNNGWSAAAAARAALGVSFIGYPEPIKPRETRFSKLRLMNVQNQLLKAKSSSTKEITPDTPMNLVKK